jgi:hypothetical protein
VDGGEEWEKVGILARRINSESEKWLGASEIDIFHCLGKPP